jgi:hypothetical protein
VQLITEGIAVQKSRTRENNCGKKAISLILVRGPPQAAKSFFFFFEYDPDLQESTVAIQHGRYSGAHICSWVQKDQLRIGQQLSF